MNNNNGNTATHLFLVNEIPIISVALGIGLLMWFEAGLLKGALMFAFVFIIMQPFVLVAYFKMRKNNSGQ